MKVLKSDSECLQTYVPLIVGLFLTPADNDNYNCDYVYFFLCCRRVLCNNDIVFYLLCYC